MYAKIVESIPPEKRIPNLIFLSGILFRIALVNLVSSSFRIVSLFFLISGFVLKNSRRISFNSPVNMLNSTIVLGFSSFILVLSSFLFSFFIIVSIAFFSEAYIRVSFS